MVFGEPSLLLSRPCLSGELPQIYLSECHSPWLLAGPSPHVSFLYNYTHTHTHTHTHIFFTGNIANNSPKHWTGQSGLLATGVESPDTPLAVDVPEENVAIVAGGGQKVRLLPCKTQDVLPVLPGTKTLGNGTIGVSGITVWGNVTWRYLTWGMGIETSPVGGQHLVPTSDNDSLLQKTQRGHLEWDYARTELCGNSEWKYGGM